MDNDTDYKSVKAVRISNKCSKTQIISRRLVLCTQWPVRLLVRTPGFQSGKKGSIPLRATSSKDAKRADTSLLMKPTSAIDLVLFGPSHN